MYSALGRELSDVMSLDITLGAAAQATPDAG
jgi:hypothetical protein